MYRDRYNHAYFLRELAAQLASVAPIDEVLLMLEPGAVVVSIQDDGQGFTGPTSTVALLCSGHFGLAGMCERAERLGGSVEISSRRGSGARVHVRIPRVPVVDNV